MSLGSELGVGRQNFLAVLYVVCAYLMSRAYIYIAEASSKGAVCALLCCCRR